jgi:hypothetical protein
MNGKNAYLKKQRKLQQGFMDVGEEMGMQKVCDYLHIALRDPEVMGKDTFGRKRLEKLFHKLNELANYYHTAFTDDKEADLVQEELDRNLKDVYGEDMQPFFQRYPYVKKQEYKKPRKGWVE